MIAVATVVSSAAALARNIEYTGNTGIWHDAGSWAPPVIPTADDHVLLGPGTCRITKPAECASIEVIGELVVEAGQSLTLSADSTIFGRLNLEGTDARPAALYLGDDVMLAGELGVLEMWNGRIESAGDRRSTLTLDYVQRAPHVKPPFRLVGDGEIRVRLVNNVWVAAEHAGRALRVARPAVGGLKPNPSPALWMASYGGVLEVAAPVSGTGEFIIGDASTLDVRAACESLHASVLLRNAMLRVRAPFATSGALKATGRSQVVSRGEGRTAFGEGR